MSNAEEEIYNLNQLYLDPNDRVAKDKVCQVASAPVPMPPLLAVLMPYPLTFTCTKEHGHIGEHGAHGMEGTILARWVEGQEPILTPMELL